MLKTPKTPKAQKAESVVRPLWRQFIGGLGLRRVAMHVQNCMTLWREFLRRRGLATSRPRKAAPSLNSRWLRAEPLEERRLLAVTPFPAPRSLLPAFDANTVLIAEPIPAASIAEGTVAKVVPLVNYFEEGGVPATGLEFQVTSDSDASLFQTAPQVEATGLLLLHPAFDASGTAEIMVQATDSQGQSASDTVVVQVSHGDVNTPGTTTNGASGGASGIVDSQPANGGADAPSQGLSAVITTVAGYGTAGYSGDGAAAPSAQLSDPYGVAVDAEGDLFIADTCNNVVREVSASTGVITTVAGNGTAGYSGDGGQATSAQLNWPMAVAVDNSGNLFIADYGNNVVREVNLSTGVISTVAGTYNALGYSGDGGPATSAGLYGPMGLAVDASGNLFISDFFNDVIREVAPNGTITTVAGTYDALGYSGDGGPATSADLYGPGGLAVDASGNLFIADINNNAVRKVDLSTGVISTVAGDGIFGDSGDGGAATRAELGDPEGVAVDAAGNLFIVDSLNNGVREVTGGVITTAAGDGDWGYSGDGGLATSAQLSWPMGVAVDASGDLFIADTYNDVVREVSEKAVATVSVSDSESSPVDVGQDLTFTATVSATDAGSAAPTGSVEFFAGTTDLGSGALNTSGVATLTTSALAVGTNEVTAFYRGDSNTLSAVSPAMSQNVLAETNVSAPDLPDCTYGDCATIYADVTALSGTFDGTGSVDFYVDGSWLTSDYVDGNGVAQASFSDCLSPGDHTLTAVYDGDANYAASTSPPSVETVYPCQTEVDIPWCTDYSGPTLQAMAEVNSCANSQFAPTGGSVDFYDETIQTDLGQAVVSSSEANLYDSPSLLYGGTHVIDVTYSGSPDGGFAGSSNQFDLYVDPFPTATVLTSSGSSLVLGQSVTLTATINSGYDGSSIVASSGDTVEFFDGSQSLGTAPVEGNNASLTVTHLATGDNELTAVFSGDEGYYSSTSDAITVNEVQTSISAPALMNPTYGDSTFLAAQVTSSSGTFDGGGTVEFFDGTTLLASAQPGTDGVAFAPFYDDLSVGDHTLTAVYSGDGNYPGSTSPAYVQEIDPCHTVVCSCSFDSNQWALNSVLAATSGPPEYNWYPPSGGSVDFYDETTQTDLVGQTVVHGSLVSLYTTPASLHGGTHVIDVTYSGSPDGDFAGCTGSFDLWVPPSATNTILTSSCTSQVCGQPVTLTATVFNVYPVCPIAASGGTVEFFNGNQGLGSAAVEGNTASLTVTDLPVGENDIVACYSGDSMFTASQSEPMSQEVDLRPLYWDPSQSGGQDLGGCGTWVAGSSDACWYDPIAQSDVAWIDGSRAVFSGCGGTVNISGSVVPAAIEFDSGYTLSPADSSGVLAVPASGVTIDAETGTTTIIAPFSGGGTVKVIGGMTLSSDNSGFTGTVIVQAGTLEADSPAALGGDGNLRNVIVDTGATLAVAVGASGSYWNSSTDDIAALLGSATFANGAWLGIDTTYAAGGFSYAGTIANTSRGALGLVVLGDNTLTLSGADSYTGGTKIDSGMLQFAAAPLPGSGIITIQSGGALEADGAYSNAYDWLQSGWIDPGSTGTLALAADEGAIDLSGYPTLSLGAATDVIYTGTITPYNDIIYRLGGGPGTLTVASTVNDYHGNVCSIVVGGNVVLDGDSTSGGTDLENGMLQLGAGGTLGTGPLTVNGGTLNLNGNSITVPSLAGNGGTITGNSLASGEGTTTLTVDQSTTTTFKGVLADGANGQELALNMTGVGSLALAGADTFSGTTHAGNSAGVSGAIVIANPLALQNSTLVDSNDNTPIDPDNGFVFASDVTTATIAGLSGGESFSLENADGVGINLIVGNNGQSTTFKGCLWGTGSLTKVGSGTFTLALPIECPVPDTYSSGTTLDGGMLVLDYTTALGAGPLTVNGGTLNLNGNSITVPGLAGTGGTITDDSSTSGTTTLYVHQSGTSAFAGVLASGTNRNLVLNVSGTGTLQLQGDNSLYQVDANGATVDVSGSLGAGCQPPGTSGGGHVFQPPTGALLSFGGGLTLGSCSYGVNGFAGGMDSAGDNGLAEVSGTVDGAPAGSIVDLEVKWGDGQSDSFNVVDSDPFTLKHNYEHVDAQEQIFSIGVVATAGDDQTTSATLSATIVDSGPGANYGGVDDGSVYQITAFPNEPMQNAVIGSAWTGSNTTQACGAGDSFDWSPASQSESVTEADDYLTDENGVGWPMGWCIDDNPWAPVLPQTPPLPPPLPYPPGYVPAPPPPPPVPPAPPLSGVPGQFYPDTPTLSITETDPGKTVLEGTPAHFEVTVSGSMPNLDPPHSAPNVTCFYETEDGSGASVADYASTDGPELLTLHFDPAIGDYTGKITVFTTAKATDLSDKTFSVVISDPYDPDSVYGGESLGNSSATATIVHPLSTDADNNSVTATPNGNVAEALFKDASPGKIVAVQKFTDGNSSGVADPNTRFVPIVITLPGGCSGVLTYSIGLQLWTGDTPPDNSMVSSGVTVGASTTFYVEALRAGQFTVDLRSQGYDPTGPYYLSDEAMFTAVGDQAPTCDCCSSGATPGATWSWINPRPTGRPA